jgi:hypothetical protein
MEEVIIHIRKVKEYINSNPDLIAQNIRYPYNYNIATNELEFFQMSFNNLSIISEFLKMIKADVDLILLQL